jgi:hypothetical protein
VTAQYLPFVYLHKAADGLRRPKHVGGEKKNELKLGCC